MVSAIRIKSPGQSREKMLASNIGQHNIEELNLVLPGHDYGWPTREGSFMIDLRASTRKLYPLSADDESFNMDYPVAEYDHDEGNAIIGGYEYWGSAIPRLDIGIPSAIGF